jgi:hypothetical protein
MHLSQQAVREIKTERETEFLLRFLFTFGSLIVIQIADLYTRMSCMHDSAKQSTMPVSLYIGLDEQTTIANCRRAQTKAPVNYILT